eukprot:SAG22_NODE_74_length_22289_cov_65.265119_9_plen_98_part_00
MSTKPLSFCCASTVFLSKTMPFRAVPLSQVAGRKTFSQRFEEIHEKTWQKVSCTCKALLFCCVCCVAARFMSKTVPFLVVCLSLKLPAGRRAEVVGE